MRPPWMYLAILLILLCSSPIAHPFDNPSANLSTTWNINNQSTPNTFIFNDGSRIIAILLPKVEDLLACGFYKCGNCTSSLFAILVVSLFDDTKLIPPDVIWSANRDQPVGIGAILNFTTAGDLVLQDVDGIKVWSCNTSGKSVVGMKLTNAGNLVLFDVEGKVVWQSFDHPTDCLVVGQKLFEGDKLVPSVSSTNWTAQHAGSYSLQVTNKGFFAYVGSNPPQVYYTIWSNDTEKTSKERSYVWYLNGNFSFFFHSTDPSEPDGWLSVLPAYGIQYMKLMPDGHLKLFQWQQGWIGVGNALYTLEECDYPLACGRNAICSSDQNCSCPFSPGKEYFQAVKNQQPNLGCSEITPLACNSTQDQVFLALKDVKHTTSIPNMVSVSMEDCKQVCMNTCSCKAALFQYYDNSSSGDCYLPSELFTMKTIDPEETQLNALAFLKVQNIRTPPLSPSQTPNPSPKRENRVAEVVGSVIGSIVLVLVAVIGIVVRIVHKRQRDAEREEEYLDQVPGMPTRFSYEKLKAATNDFCKKLGQGGFGSVFEGTLEDGSKIAVKHLEGHKQVKKSFLAEVESIGGIHHVNLVRLRGFCAWKSQRLLVYEFMSNGSLDRWIYHGNRERTLEWECRKKVILDIAKGLAYLHEDCRKKIIHLDIKPQNILLDNDFNAKIADFGLSKLVDRNQTQVITTRRGTLGYMAPEWLSSIITEKVDVYSFGILLLEILCGRKNFDRSEPEESWHLLGVFQKMWEQGKLSELVDRWSEDMQAHGVEVVEMMKVASWCLQIDFTRRPTMSSVINAIEGVMEVESNLDYNLTYPRLQKIPVTSEIDLTQVLPSVLSGPR